MQSEQINELANALVKAQSAMKAATYNKVNPHFKNKYADLAAVIDAVRKPLSDNGLSVSQTTELTPESCLVLRTTLFHTSGQWIASEYPLPSAANPQQLGSALTYARRYSLSCITCLAADEDDDGDAAPTKDADKPKPRQRQPESGKIDQAGETPDIPHKLTVPQLPNNAGPDFRKFATELLEAMKACPDKADIFEWQKANQPTLDEMAKRTPMMFKNLAKAVGEITNDAS